MLNHTVLLIILILISYCVNINT